MSEESLTSQESRRRWMENPGTLRRIERVWKDRQKWLEERGYMLRSRYNADWKPSWTGTDKIYYECENGQMNPVSDCSQNSILMYLDNHLQDGRKGH